jgi:uncharacterized protein
VAMEIHRPVTKTDYDHVRWYLAHDQVHIFVDHDRKWFVEFKSPCSFLDGKNRCTVYGNRPKICRNHGNLKDECEYFDIPYRHYFESIESFETYLKKKKINWKFIR